VDSTFFNNLNAQVSTIETPPNTLRLNDSLFIDKAPITLEFFREYFTENRLSKLDTTITRSKLDANNIS
jgi:hypothetical protein